MDPDPTEAGDEALAPVAHEARAWTRRQPLDWVVGLSALAVALTAAVAGLAFFAEFVATDTDPWQLAQAAALAFGVTGLMIAPFALVGVAALRARSVGRLWTVVLLGPWIAVGAVWIRAGRFDPLIGALPALVAALAIWRAFRMNAR